jgi:hypothetical protein
VVSAGDDAGKELPKARFGMPVEEDIERGVEGERGAVVFGKDELVCVDGREGLQLDEARGEAAAGLADESEVDGHEVRVRRFVGGMPGFGDGFAGCGKIFGVADKLVGEVSADGRHFGQQFAGQEDGSLSDAEADVSADAGIEIAQKGAVGFGTEARIEVLPQRGDHANRVNPQKQIRFGAGRETSQGSVRAVPDSDLWAATPLREKACSFWDCDRKAHESCRAISDENRGFSVTFVVSANFGNSIGASDRIS